MERRLYEGMLPKERIDGHRGYYPCCNKEEFEALPDCFKWMDFFSAEVNKLGYDGKFRKERTHVEYVIFDCRYIAPYGVSAKVKVHRDDVLKCLFNLYENKGILLHSICGVEFENGVECGAEWLQDTKTGSYMIKSQYGTVAKQGGYLGYVPQGSIWDGEKFVYNQEIYSINGRNAISCRMYSY